MSDPQRRPVRVRRSPRIGVFLVLGALVGVIAAVVVVDTSPADAHTPPAQAIGFLAVLLGALGMLLGGVVALLLDAALGRRARTVEAERIAAAGPSAPPAEEDAEADARSEQAIVDEGRSHPS